MILRYLYHYFVILYRDPKVPTLLIYHHRKNENIYEKYKQFRCNLVFKYLCINIKATIMTLEIGNYIYSYTVPTLYLYQVNSDVYPKKISVASWLH